MGISICRSENFSDAVTEQRSNASTEKELNKKYTLRTVLFFVMLASKYSAYLSIATRIVHSFELRHTINNCK